MKSTPKPEPGLRADAADNRRRLIEAARSAFAERGLDAPLDAIARSAGVGNATLYRRFPTRNDLVAAVFSERLIEYAETAEAALDDPDPWAGFCSYVERVCELQAADAGAAEVLATTFPNVPGIELYRARAYEAFSCLVHRAQAAGQLRSDFAMEDFLILMLANVGIVQGLGALAAPAMKRFSAIFLAGLRAEVEATLPPPIKSNELSGQLRSRIQGKAQSGAARPD
ncbi:TetR/AcrR family transcriptional regulator [Pseudochelatococcus lubricantis]|uniref:TetR/AcrR family transcriptional regulator n=1 Tax=Pseudochelatococcus lubricantis TaxID=1538102 RepID=UPI0035EE7D45